MYGFISWEKTFTDCFKIDFGGETLFTPTNTARMVVKQLVYEQTIPGTTTDSALVAQNQCTGSE